ncbi:MAG: 2-amino-4-hydroxy-6-hydroxymethyldihydropteridine diphosphokinase, partial [Planctomycetota bacterium]|nr:2-amino-4-hydroxy-6-hydroxymethyldihydropteridine diphosphokinase [Planctomycetota bacterium]
MTAVLAAVAFGSNLGDRAGQIEAALAGLAGHDGVEVLAASRCLETRPVGGPPQGDFLNGAVLLRTTLDPRGLLELLHHLERRAGRVREGAVPNAPRPLDLDLL